MTLENSQALKLTPKLRLIWHRENVLQIALHLPEQGARLPRGPHMLRTANRRVGEASWLEPLHAPSPGGLSTARPTQVTPNRGAVIFHWEPQGFRGAAEVQDHHIAVPSEPWPLRLPATSSRNLCPLQTLRTLPTSAQQLPATANHFVWD